MTYKRKRYDDGGKIVIPDHELFYETFVVDKDYAFAKGGVVGWTESVRESDKHKKYWGRKAGCVGSIDYKFNGKMIDIYLYPLDEFDNKFYSHIRLKDDEVLFRYRTHATDIAGMKPIVKVNLKKGLLYYLADLYAEDDVNLVFERKGIKATHLSYHESVVMKKRKRFDTEGYTLPFAKGGVVKKRKRYDDGDLEQQPSVEDIISAEAYAKGGVAKRKRYDDGGVVVDNIEFRFDTDAEFQEAKRNGYIPDYNMAIVETAETERSANSREEMNKIIFSCRRNKERIVSIRQSQSYYDKQDYEVDDTDTDYGTDAE